MENRLDNLQVFIHAKKCINVAIKSLKINLNNVENYFELDNSFHSVGTYLFIRSIELTAKALLESIEQLHNDCSTELEIRIANLP